MFPRFLGWYQHWLHRQFIISNLPAHLGSPVQGMSQQHTKNKQQQTMSLSRSVCATRWLRLFTPPISSNWRRAEAKKQTKTKAMLVSAAASSCCCHSFCELDDEAFGYLKRVIVTPAVYPRFQKITHPNTRSTGQNSQHR